MAAKVLEVMICCLGPEYPTVLFKSGLAEIV